MTVDAAKFGWKPSDILEVSGKPDAVKASAFGKPDQQRDYHGRWGKGGKPLSGGDAYRHINERQKRIESGTVEKYALGQYVNGRAEGMNYALRQGKGKVNDSDEKVVIDRVELAVKNYGVKIEQPILVHRGINKVEKAFGTKDVKKLVGAEITDHGFMSTTTNPKIGTSFRGPGGGAVVNITVPKGRQVLGVDKARGGSMEQEMLLQRGTTIRVTDATKTGTHWTIDAEVV